MFGTSGQNYAKTDNKVFWFCPISPNFLLFQYTLQKTVGNLSVWLKVYLVMPSHNTTKKCRFKIFKHYFAIPKKMKWTSNVAAILFFSFCLFVQRRVKILLNLNLMLLVIPVIYANMLAVQLVTFKFQLLINDTIFCNYSPQSGSNI